MTNCSPCNTGPAPLPPAAAAAAPSTQDVQEHALWIRETLGPPRSPARPRALQALWINFPSQLHPSPGDRLSLPSSPNDFGLPPTPETLIFLPTTAAHHAAGYSSFHFIPRQLQGLAPACCSSSRSPAVPRTPVLQHRVDGELFRPRVCFVRGFPLAKGHEQAKTLREVEGERQGRVAPGSSGGSAVHSTCAHPAGAIRACSNLSLYSASLVWFR